MFFKQGDLVGGRFEIINLLGEGGVGRVYGVNDRNSNDKVALKVLRPEIAKNRLALERFMREVKAVREINHPSIAQVRDTGRIGDILFYTMEWIQGDSIHARIKEEKQFDLAIASAVMLEICEVMEKVHAVAVHRDLSSDNIMIQPDGSIRILDFGTARLTQEESDLTQVGLHLGKIAYSAPEQRSDSKTVDHRADLYSLVVLFFEMLTGELITPYDPIADQCTNIPDNFQALFEKGLAERPDDRYQSAAELRMAIQELKGSESH